MKYTSLVVALLSQVVLFGQSSAQWMPFAQQSNLRFSSDHVSINGVGFGAGIAAALNQNLILQTDMNVYWLNGNAFKNSFAIGYRKKGTWSPAVFGTFGVLWGSRTEVLFEDGTRPSPVTCALGLKLAPLRFEHEKGFVSALEFGYAVSKYKGTALELTLLSVGLKL